MKRTLNQIKIYFTVFVFLTSCQSGFLEINPDKSHVIPNSIEDFQALLDNSLIINQGSSTELSVIGSDEYHLKSDIWNLLAIPEQKNGYIWAKDIFEGNSSRDWNNGYERIFYANICLEGIEKVSKDKNNEEGWNNVKGSALFIRALNIYNLAQLFATPFDAKSAENDLGIPLRIESDINMPVTRSTLKQTYDQVLSDLNQSLPLLPVKPLVIERPSKAAAYALLARTYMQLQQFEEAKQNATLALDIQNQLIDYNEVDLKLTYPFPLYAVGNKEVIFNSWLPVLASLSPGRMLVNNELYNLYEESDLRKRIFFKVVNNEVNYNGSYVGYPLCFTGITTSELLLIKAECEARVGHLNDARNTINRLLENRIENRHFDPIKENDGRKLLVFILNERRKELAFRGLRWEDLRRLNKEEEHAVTLRRTVNDIDYELEPQSIRYTLPIPDEVVKISGLKQNTR